MIGSVLIRKIGRLRSASDSVDHADRSIAHDIYTSCKGGDDGKGSSGNAAGCGWIITLIMLTIKQITTSFHYKGGQAYIMESEWYPYLFSL